MPRKQDVTRQWHCLDAEGKTLGRLAVEVAGLLRGKHKPQYSPHVDCGDFVVVVNADKVVVSGDKASQTLHYRHSGYPGGLKASLLADEIARHPERVLRRAVRGMMPKNRLSRQMLKKLKVYAGPDHPHQAQFAGEPGEPGKGKNRKAKARKADAEKPAKRATGRKKAAKPEPEEVPPEPEALDTPEEAPEETPVEAPSGEVPEAAADDEDAVTDADTDEESEEE